MIFHNTVITTSIVFCLGISFLQISYYFETNTIEILLLGMSSVAVSVSLVFYLQSLFRKRDPTEPDRIDHSQFRQTNESRERNAVG